MYDHCEFQLLNTSKNMCTILQLNTLRRVQIVNGTGKGKGVP